MKAAHEHQPNGLRARNDQGQMVCAICGHGYDPAPAPVVVLDQALTPIEVLRPCPSWETAVLGFERPTRIPCGLLEGHAGLHHYEMSWGAGQSATSEDRGMS